MKTGARLAVYGLGVASVFGLAAAVGAALGPIDSGASADHSSMAPVSPAPDELGLGGLTVAANGYELVSDFGIVEPGTPSMPTFRIEDADGSVVTAFDLLNDRRMHLIVLSRNLVDYLHLHPVVDADGTWTAELPPLRAGSYRVYADFQPHGAEPITLATDISVPGLVGRSEVPDASRNTEVDGFSVGYTGVAAVGESSLAFDVTRDGQRIVTDPYLGSAGHLVVIRDGDLGYLHVHPLEGEDGPVRFVVEFPTPGRYRLFFEFSTGGTVRTASFTVHVASGGRTDHDPSMSDDQEGHSS